MKRTFIRFKIPRTKTGLSAKVMFVSIIICNFYIYDINIINGYEPTDRQIYRYKCVTPTPKNINYNIINEHNVYKINVDFFLATGTMQNSLD